VYKFNVSEYVLPGVVSGSVTPANTLAELQLRMKSIMDRIVSTSGISMENFDYPHQIREYDDQKQKELWCLRTLLFYQLLMTTTEMMNNEGLFNEVYQYSTSNGITPNGITPNGITPKRTFRKDIVAELKNYKLGIFGSITPSSDIDLGVQFSGFNTLVGLAHIVSVFEDSFLIFTGKSSLKFDIETYADLVTVPDINDKTDAASLTCSNVRDVFPYDTSKLIYLDFLKLLPFVFAGILRNFIIAQQDIGSRGSVAEIVGSFNIDDFLAVTTKKTETDFLEIVRSYATVPGNVDKELWDAFDQAKNIAIGYMEAPYEKKREEYYKLVQTAETSTVQLKTDYFATGIVDISSHELTEILMNASKALVYREESYTCFPTVMHVVRVMQANPGKYKTLTPSYCLTTTNKLGDAYCAIGNYGYLISLFEQLGYIYRFDITYCKPGHLDKIKCPAKFKKYADRFKNGLNFISPPQQSLISKVFTMISPEPERQKITVSSAGGSRRRRTLKKKSMKTMKRKIMKRKTMKRKAMKKAMKKKQ
jgi:hypothetical protein